MSALRHSGKVRHGKGGKQRVVPITDTVDDDEIRAAMTGRGRRLANRGYRTAAGPARTRHAAVSGGAYTTPPHAKHVQVVCPPTQSQGWCPTSVRPGAEPVKARATLRWPNHPRAVCAADKLADCGHVSIIA